jgi:hypothetical protein
MLNKLARKRRLSARLAGYVELLISELLTPFGIGFLQFIGHNTTGLPALRSAIVCKLARIITLETLGE